MTVLKQQTMLKQQTILKRKCTLTPLYFPCCITHSLITLTPRDRRHNLKFPSQSTNSPQTCFLLRVLPTPRLDLLPGPGRMVGCFPDSCHRFVTSYDLLPQTGLIPSLGTKLISNYGVYTTFDTQWSPVTQRLTIPPPPNRLSLSQEKNKREE